MKKWLTFLYCLLTIILFGQDSNNLIQKCQIIEDNIDTTDRLTWTTINEKDSMTFDIEHFRWNKWLVVGRIKGQGLDTNHYSHDLVFHSGENRFRIKTYDKGDIYSSELNYKNTTPDDGRWIWKVHKELTLKDTSDFTIYDAYGEIVLEGTGKVIDVKKLKRGTYYINYKDQMDKFLKK